MAHAAGDDSRRRAQEEVRKHYGASKDDVLISCDGPWQKMGFSSLLGFVLVSAEKTGTVLYYTVLSQRCIE